MGRERLQSEIMGGPDLPWMFPSPPNPNCTWDSGTYSSYNMKSQNGPRISPRSSSPTSSWSEGHLVPASVACCGSISTQRSEISCSSLLVRGLSNCHLPVLPLKCSLTCSSSLIIHQFQKRDALGSFLLFIIFMFHFSERIHSPSCGSKIREA